MVVSEQGIRVTTVGLSKVVNIVSTVAFAHILLLGATRVSMGEGKFDDF